MSILNSLNPRDNPEFFRPPRIRDEFDPNTPFGKFINTTSKVFDPIRGTSITPMDLFYAVPQAMSGDPFAMTNLGIEALRAFAPENTFEQRMIRDFYEGQFGLDNMGKIQSGIMKGYSPVYGRDGSAGLGPAIDRRIETIRKTLARKYGDPNYKGPKTKLDEKIEKLLGLKQREEDARKGITQAMGIGFGGSTSGDRAGGGGFGGDTAGGFSESNPTATEGSFRYGGIASL